MIIPQVIFVYSRSKIHWGSTLMRAQQISAIIQPFANGLYITATSALPSSKTPWLQMIWAKLQKPNSLLIFTKYAAENVIPEALLILKRKNCYVACDYIDSDLNRMHESGFDVHIACSYSAQRKLNEIKIAKEKNNCKVNGEVMLLLHNADEYFYHRKTTTNKKETFNMVYFGNRKTAFLTPKIESQLTYLDASNTVIFKKNISNLENYNFHYCVRPMEEQATGLVCKPFTKGFTAAMMNANLIVNRNTDDVVDFLGNDYPYLIDSVDEATIQEKIYLAKQSFGSSEWTNALEIMETVKNRISPQALNKQVLDMLKFVNIS